MGKLNNALNKKSSGLLSNARKYEKNEKKKSYDHPNILAGQGTMALEIIEQIPDVDAIVVPTGGGGLLAGIAVAAKSMNPNIMIIVNKHFERLTIFQLLGLNKIAHCFICFQVS